MSSPDVSKPDPADVELPDIGVLATASIAAGIAIEPSELHGSLCGNLAGGGSTDADNWLQQLAVEADVAPAPDGALAQLRSATLAQFDAQDFGFELLLPDDNATLAERADALIG
ncbi:MAG: UPF0149 family protein, partial [Lysobacteraceae bacterium]